jgi:uncharacterized membrane protein HdeD (DUF308 family)
MAPFPILNIFARNWYLLLIRGILAVVFGILAFGMPKATILALTLLYGVYAFADGLTALWVGTKSRAWALALAGVLGLLVGAYAMFYPGITAIALLYVIAAWAIIRGVFEIVTGFQLRKEISHEWALIVGGLFSILFGMVLFANPAAGAMAVIWIIGAFAVVFGLIMIVLAFHLRGLPGRFEKLGTHAD